MEIEESTVIKRKLHLAGQNRDVMVCFRTGGLMEIDVDKVIEHRFPIARQTRDFVG